MARCILVIKWLLTNLKQQKNQVAFVINNPDRKPERSAHRIEEYSKETTQNYQLANVMKNCVLYNMLNNSVQNFESNSFIPLGLDCLTLPKSLRFTQATQPLEKLKIKKELYDMGISNFITCDAHDPRGANSTPIKGFDNFTPPYQFIKALLSAEQDLLIDKDHLVVLSDISKPCCYS